MTMRSGRVAVVGALGMVSLALVAAPAYAKGNVDITAPRTAQAGKAFTVTARGDDDAARYLRVCLEGRGDGHGWRQVSCGAPVITGSGARDTAHIRAAHGGLLEFRAVLYRLSGPRDHHPVRWRTSRQTAVRVR